MSLFQKSVLNKYLNEQDASIVQSAYQKYKVYFHNSQIQHNIRESKEEQFQEGFLRELFVKVFGYVLNPNPDFNLTTELKNEKGAKKADGAVIKDGKAIAVIELKSTKTKDLESIRQQAFDYKANQSECVYVITSNFQKLRFYINNAVEFEEFDLFALSEDRFKVLYLCLNSDNLLSELPLKIKNASILEEEQITKKFYNDYSLFKKELFEDIATRNTGIEGVSKLQLYKKTQKLLDRFLFIFFAEDRGLLPPNSISRMIKRWNVLNDEDAYKPLYDIYKQYFGYLNTGRPGKVPADEIQAYNGGLFLPDEILDKIEIDDAILLRHTSTLTNYDFDSQVGVNILGHIFEHSLNEIETTTAKLEGVDFDKQKSKRKKDGIFYTPKFITKYIVDNTVGKLCNDKKEELEIEEEEYKKTRKGRRNETIQKLKTRLANYRNWLLSLTILDPACGSGAFLNQALDFLIKEHTYIDELETSLFGDSMLFPNIENTILENNIYGVDINEESVDIARLSLWLRTAQRGRKLTTLNKNIKCGNSLIDDPKVVGDKAFKWRKEFPRVFEKGGFDVVVGNPPYVQLQNNKELSLKIKKLGYKTYESTGDLYCLFYEKGNDILRQGGLLGYITSSKWMRANYGKSMRQYLMRNTNPYILIELGAGIFDSAVVDSNLIFFKKEVIENIVISSLDLVKLKNIRDFTSFENKFIDVFPMDDSVWTIMAPVENSIRQKIDAKGIPLRDWDVKMNFGIKTGYNEAFLIDSETKNRIIKEDPKSSELIKPLLRGRDIQRFYAKFAEQWLISTFPALNIDIDQYVGIKKYLKSFGKRIEQSGEKGSRKKTHNKWFETQDSISYYEEFDNDLLIWKRIGSILRFSYGKYYCLDSTCILASNHNKYLLCVFNSKMGHYLMKDSPKTGTGDLLVSVQAIEPIKIPQIANELLFNNFADLMIELHKDIQKLIDYFLKYITSQYKVEVFSRKLQNWHELEFGEFIKELNKAIKKAGGDKLSKMDEMDWMEVFETKKDEVQTLKAEIDKTDKEIDRMVYELYGLSKEEIKIVEGK